MYQEITENKTTINCKIPICILSIVALVLRAISSLTYFVTHSYIDPSNITFRMPTQSVLCTIFLTLLPCVLLFVYCAKENKATLLIPITFISLALPFLFGFVELVLIIPSLFIEAIKEYLIPLIFFSVVTIFAFKGLKNKIVVVGLLVANVICYAILQLNIGDVISNYMYHGLYVMLVCYVAGVISFFVLNLALILFVSTNKIPPIVVPKEQTQDKDAI